MLSRSSKVNTTAFGIIFLQKSTNINFNNCFDNERQKYMIRACFFRASRQSIRWRRQTAWRSPEPWWCHLNLNRVPVSAFSSTYSVPVPKTRTQFAREASCFAPIRAISAASSIGFSTMALGGIAKLMYSTNSSGHFICQAFCVNIGNMNIEYVLAEMSTKRIYTQITDGYGYEIWTLEITTDTRTYPKSVRWNPPSRLSC